MTPSEGEAGFGPSRALLRDGVAAFGSSLVAAFTLLALGRVAQLVFGGLLATLFLSTAAPGGGATAGLGPVSLTVGSTPGLVAVTIGLSLGLAFAGWLTYRGRSRVAELASSFERSCSERTVAAGLPHLGADLSERDLLRLATRDARYAGRGLAEIGAAMVPAVTVILGITVLVVLDVVLTGALLLLALLAWPMHRAVIRRGSRSMVGIETLSRTDALEKAKLLASLEATRHPDTDLVAAVRTALDTPTYRDYLASYTERLKAPHVSVLVGSVQSAMLAGAALLLLVSAEVVAETPLPSIVLYFFVLQFVLASTLSLGKHANNLRIFQTQFQRVLALIDGDVARPEPASPDGGPVLAYLSPPGPPPPCDVVVVLDGPADRAHVRRATRALIEAGIWTAEDGAREGLLTVLPPARDAIEAAFYADLHGRASDTSGWAAVEPTLVEAYTTADGTEARLDRLFVGALGMTRTTATFVALNAKDYIRLDGDRRAALHRERGSRPLLLCLPYTKKVWPVFERPLLVVPVVGTRVRDVCWADDALLHRSDWDELFAGARREVFEAEELLDDIGLEDA